MSPASHSFSRWEINVTSGRSEAAESASLGIARPIRHRSAVQTFLLPFVLWHPSEVWPQPSMEKLLVPLLLLLCITGASFALDCFKCVSYDGDNPACDEPFHNNFSSAILESPCMGGRKDRAGVFPATACLKLEGTFDDTGKKMVVRGCGLDSGTLTVDTEIVRMSHCGGFLFMDRYVRGCVQSCFEDGCNGIASLVVTVPLLFALLFLHGHVL